MSIASEISALQADKTAIANAITAKGGTVASGDGFDDFAAAIASIPSGAAVVTGTFTGNQSNSVTIAELKGKTNFCCFVADTLAGFGGAYQYVLSVCTFGPQVGAKKCIFLLNGSPQDQFLHTANVTWDDAFGTITVLHSSYANLRFAATKYIYVAW